MLARDDILACLADLNEELRKLGSKGEIGIVGGAVMCLVYNTRHATRDVDAIFEPSAIIRDAAARIAAQRGLPRDWLNDGVKGFLTGNFARESVATFSNLEVWAPEPRYMLAMKCLSARWDTSDADDVAFLAGHLGVTDPQSVFALLEHYYPSRQIPPKTQFFIEELLGGDRSG